MVGAEVATIAAAESHDPGKAIARATNSVILRIAVFFVGSIFLLAVILPWNSAELEASPYVSAFKVMGIPYADHIMNAVVLTAVLSCLNSGLYTSSRMLFVLAARREAPVALMSVNKAGVPMAAILSSTVVGFLCVIAAAVSPDRVFSFLLNSSGAVILFVYLLIAISQIILRRRTSPEKLTVKMWAFPVLSFIVVAAILAVLAQMAFDEDARTQLLLSLASWAIVVVIFFATKRLRGRAPAEIAAAPGEPGAPAERVLVLANETVNGDELLDELRAIDEDRNAEYFVCVPANPIDTGQAMHRRGGVRLAGHHGGRSGPAGPNAGDPARGEPARGRSARQLQAAPGAGRCGGGVQAGPAGHLHPSRGSVGLAPLRRGRARPGDLRHPDHPRDRRVRPGRVSLAGQPMTIVIGLAPNERGAAAVHLGSMLARSISDDWSWWPPWSPRPGRPTPTGSTLSTWPYQEKAAEEALAVARTQIGPDLSVELVIHHARSVSSGLLEVARRAQRHPGGPGRLLGRRARLWCRSAGWPSASCTAPTSR